MPVAADEPAPAPYAGSIKTVDNESDTSPSSPFAPGDVKVTNVFSESDGTRETAVYAGALAEDPQQGVLIVMSDRWDTGAQTATTRATTVRGGALTLTGIDGDLLEYRDASGNAGSFDRDLMTFEPPPDPRASAVADDGRNVVVRVAK